MADLTTDASATVVAVDGAEATVRVDETGCGRCHQQGGCGGHHLGRFLCSRPRTFVVANPEGCVVGQRVHVDLSAGILAKTVWHVYVVPLLMLLAGAGSGSFLAGEAGAMGGSMAGVMIGWLRLRRVQRHIGRAGHTQVSIRP